MSPRAGSTDSGRSASRHGTSAAGSLLILEAGGLISDYDGEANYLDSGHVVCGSPKVFVQLLQLVQATRGG